MIKHIVMWTVKDGVDGKSKKENIQQLKGMLEALPEKINEIRALEVGINFNPSEAAFDIVLYTEFDDRNALQIYQDHPEHVKVKEFVARVRDKRAVVDYEI